MGEYQCSSSKVETKCWISLVRGAEIVCWRDGKGEFINVGLSFRREAMAVLGAKDVEHFAGCLPKGDHSGLGQTSMICNFHMIGFIKMFLVVLGRKPRKIPLRELEQIL